MTIAAGGVLTHEYDGVATANENDKRIMDVAGDLTVESGGAISVKGRGYGGPNNVYNSAGYGLGGSPGRAGSSHGGQGANSGDFTASDVTYGSVLNPVNYGSGGGSRQTGYNQNGGGAIILSVGGAMTVEGLVDADGKYYSDRSAAAGGSVNISAASFAGTGSISAKGGKGQSNGAGAGGGRISLKVSTGNVEQFDTLAITAAGGTTANGGLSSCF